MQIWNKNSKPYNKWDSRDSREVIWRWQPEQRRTRQSEKREWLGLCLKCEIKLVPDSRYRVFNNNKIFVSGNLLASTDKVRQIIKPCLWQIIKPCLWQIIQPCLWQIIKPCLWQIIKPCLWQIIQPCLWQIIKPCLWRPSLFTPLVNLFIHTDICDRSCCPFKTHNKLRIEPTWACLLVCLWRGGVKFKDQTVWYSKTEEKKKTIKIPD